LIAEIEMMKEVDASEEKFPPSVDTYPFLAFLK
jgi:hypothetical protein